MSIWWNVVAIVVSAFVLYIYKDEENESRYNNYCNQHTINYRKCGIVSRVIFQFGGRMMYYMIGLFIIGFLIGQWIRG